jgi:MoaA/NifB/PqqE/SkfB family radical SAM enzyme
MDMPVGMAEEAARQAYTMPDLEYVVLNCWGEPTLNPHVLQIVPMFAGLRSVLSTNCVEYVPGLKRSGMSELILSTDVDGIRAVNALRYLDAPGSPTIMVQLLVTTSTQHKVERFIEKFKPRLTENAKVFIKYPVLDPSCEDEPLRGDLYQFEDSDVVVAGEAKQARGVSCDRAQSTAVVQADGDVMLHCCTVNKEMVVGRLEDDVTKLFNSARAEDVRRTVCGLCTM